MGHCSSESAPNAQSPRHGGQLLGTGQRQDRGGIIVKKPRTWLSQELRGGSAVPLCLDQLLAWTWWGRARGKGRQSAKVGGHVPESFLGT